MADSRPPAYCLNGRVVFVHWEVETVAYDSESGDTHLLDEQASSLVRQLQKGASLQHCVVPDMGSGLDTESKILTLAHQLARSRILLPVSQP